MIVTFLKFIISVGASHCDYSPQVPKMFAIPLDRKLHSSYSINDLSDQVTVTLIILGRSFL
jgi:hypothetical protein